MSLEGNGMPQQLMEVTDVIPETGLAPDYINDVMGLNYAAKLGVAALIKTIKEFNWVPKTYQEFYPSNEYQNPVTPKNREAVEKLNAEVEKFRQRLAGNVDTLTIEEFNDYYKSIVTIIDPNDAEKYF